MGLVNFGGPRSGKLVHNGVKSDWIKECIPVEGPLPACGHSVLQCNKQVWTCLGERGLYSEVHVWPNLTMSRKGGKAGPFTGTITVNRQTHMTENTAFPQTTYAGGKWDERKLRNSLKWQTGKARHGDKLILFLLTSFSAHLGNFPSLHLN